MYIELVLFNNFAIDALLAVCTLAARRKKIGALRVVLSSVLGACAATAYPLLPALWQAVVKILLAPLMTLLFAPLDKRRKVGDFVATVFVFAIFTALIGGIAYGVGELFGVDVYGYAACGFIAIGACATVIFAWAVARKKNSSQTGIVQAVVTAGGKSVHAAALPDSGNLLQDEVSGKPVVMISKRLESELGKLPLEGFIQVETVGGESTLPLVKLDCVEVEGRRYLAYGALTHKSLKDCDVILQSTMSA